MPSNVITLGNQRKLFTDYWLKTQELAQRVVSLIDSGAIIQAKTTPGSAQGKDINALHARASASLKTAEELNANVSCLFEPEVQKYLKQSPPEKDNNVFKYFFDMTKMITNKNARTAITRIAHLLECLTDNKETLTFKELDLSILDNQDTGNRSKIGPQGKYFLGHLLAQAS